jgi:S1-C subfamily serine protease
VPAAAEPAPAPSPAPAAGRSGAPRASRLALVAAAAAVVIAGAAVALVATGVLGGGNGGDEGTAEASIPEIVDAVGPSTVVVNALVDGREAGSGSGWVLDAGEGLIVTNQHVANPGNEFRVGVGDSQRPATLFAAAPCDDLALLRVEDTSGLVALPLGSQSDLRQGQTVVALGYPGTASRRANLVQTAGVVSVVETPFDQKAVDVPLYPNVIQTDAAINPGNSGGPLVDDHERLVGVNSAGITLLDGRDVQGQGYAIGVDRVKEVLAGLRAGRPAGWTGMGFVHVTTPGEVAAELQAAGLPQVPGLVVTHAVPGSPAAEAGFGDEPATITAVNGRPMDGSLQSYCAALADGAADSASFTVVDSGPAPPRTVTVPFASGT